MWPWRSEVGARSCPALRFLSWLDAVGLGSCSQPGLDLQLFAWGGEEEGRDRATGAVYMGLCDVLFVIALFLNRRDMDMMERPPGG